MASLSHASPDLAAPVPLGAWLRQLRTGKGLPQRAVAAAANMDSSHYGKVEAGKRPLTEAQLVALARFFAVPDADFRRRQAAAMVYSLLDGDHAMAASVGCLLQEAAAAYLVDNPANKRSKKK